MPATRPEDQARAVAAPAAEVTLPATPELDHLVEIKPIEIPPADLEIGPIQREPPSTKKYGRANPDFAAMAGWRPGFGSPYHKAHIVRTLRDTSALCPDCRFDLINQRRPDCPKCGTPIDPAALLIQNAPPRPLLTRSLIAGVALSWLAMVAGGFAWAGALKALGLTALFALQLASGWALLTILTDTNWYKGVSTPNRRRLLVGAIAAAVVAGAAAAHAITRLV